MSDIASDFYLGGKKKIIRFKLYRDKIGRFIKVNGKKYRIGKDVPLVKIKKFVRDKAFNLKPRKTQRVRNVKYDDPFYRKYQLEKSLRELENVKQIQTLQEAQFKKSNTPPPPPTPPRSIKYPALYPRSVKRLKPEPEENRLEYPDAYESKEDKEDDEPHVKLIDNSRSYIRLAEDPRIPDMSEDDILHLQQVNYDPDNFDEFMSGTGKDKFKDGMSNHQIDKVMCQHPHYLGTISHDEIKSKIIPLIKTKSKGGFVINTDPHNKAGTHWQAVFFDGTPSGSHEIDFFDSYGDRIDNGLLRDIKLIADKLCSDSYLKFKENRITYQNDKSSNCGWFCCKFLIDRFRNKPFSDASGFNDVIKGEAAIEKFKTQHGGFRYIASFQPVKGGNIFTGEFYKYYPPSVRKYLIDEPITDIKVGRLPISRGLNIALNILTLGGWSRAKKEVGFSDAFHLYLIINNKYRLERNHTVSMYPYSRNSQEQIMEVPMGSKQGQITIKELLERTAEKVGPDLQRYDPSKNNCQIFVLQVLNSIGLNNAVVQDFIKQDIEKAMSKLPFYTAWLANKITDTAHLAEKTIKGNARR